TPNSAKYVNAAAPSSALRQPPSQCPNSAARPTTVIHGNAGKRFEKPSKNSDSDSPSGCASSPETPRVRSRGVNSNEVPSKKRTPYTSHSKNESIQSLSGKIQLDGYCSTQASRLTANWPSTIMASAATQYRGRF